jgi:site-specific DNA recombinase
MERVESPSAALVTIKVRSTGRFLPKARKNRSGLCYGYRVVKSLAGGTLTTGEREIEPGEAAIVDRIFREYVAGIAPKAIAKRLNHDRIAGPLGGTWSPSTIHGNWKRGTGLLNNELYVGR